MLPCANVSYNLFLISGTQSNSTPWKDTKVNTRNYVNFSHVIVDIVDGYDYNYMNVSLPSDNVNNSEYIIDNS